MTIIKTPPRPAPLAPYWEYAPAEYFHIEVGAFYDRFGAARIPVLACPYSDVQAMIRNTQVRKFIDLKRADVAQFVAYVATKVSELTAEIQAAVLATETTEDERYVKGLIQPVSAPPVPDPVSEPQP